MSSDETLTKLRQLTSALPAITDTQCLELGIFDDITRFAALDMYEDKDVSIRRGFFPEGKKLENYSHDAAIEICIVFRGRVTFTSASRVVRCAKGGLIVIPSGEAVTVEAHDKAWVLFVRML
jgi:quercetin dioxygenase-like cupin family protein